MSRSERIVAALEKIDAAKQELREAVDGLTMEDFRLGLARLDNMSAVDRVRRVVRGRSGVTFDVGSLFGMLSEGDREFVGNPFRLGACLRSLRKDGVVSKGDGYWIVN